MTEPPVSVTATRGFLPVSRQLLEDSRDLAPLLAAAMRGEGRRPEQPMLFGCDRPPDLWLRLMASRPDGLAMAVLNLHHPVAAYPWWHWVDGVPFEPRVWECGGCEFDGYEAEPPDWPCQTVGVVAQFALVAL